MSLIHRDVSPSNVLLSRAGEVKLTDFGIAKRAEQEVTGHGAVRGKFAYISPEQARNEHLDPRSDVFAVGILLWELVTNRRLFSGLVDLEALRAVRDPQVPRPRDIDSRLSPEVDALIMSALEREPQGRPTAGQLSAKLRTLRYSLDVTVGDPATELAKIIDTAEEVERQSSHNLRRVPSLEFDLGEATVIRIHTADAFSFHDQAGASASMARAREVIDRFDEEETRQALLSRDQMAFLRSSARDSGEMSSAAEPPPPEPRSRRVSDAPTRGRLPLMTEDVPTMLPDEIAGADHHFEGDEATILVPSSNRAVPDGIDGFDPTDRVARVDPRGRAAPSPTEPPPMPAPPPPPSRPQGLTPGPVIPSGTTSHPAPPSMQQPAPALIAQAQPPSTTDYASWNRPLPRPLTSAPLPSATYRQPGVQRQPPPVQGGTRHKRTPLRPWMLVIGAFIMALLAFTVTRACIHTAARPAPEAPERPDRK
jgi:serine/threonine-protein kinase